MVLYCCRRLRKKPIKDRMHYTTFKIKIDFKTLGITSQLCIWLQRQTGHTLNLFQIIPKTTNSHRNMHLVSKRCLKNETMCSKSNMFVLLLQDRISLSLYPSKTKGFSVKSVSSDCPKSAD